MARDAVGVCLRGIAVRGAAIEGRPHGPRIAAAGRWGLKQIPLTAPPASPA